VRPILLLSHLISLQNPQWTVYPNSGKDGSKRFNGRLTGIYIPDSETEPPLSTDADDNPSISSKVAMLVVGKYEEEEAGNEKAVDKLTRRRIETWRHMPVAARQFDCQGHLMDQNPEAIRTFVGQSSFSSLSGTTTTTTPIYDDDETSFASSSDRTTFTSSEHTAPEPTVRRNATVKNVAFPKEDSNRQPDTEASAMTHNGATFLPMQSPPLEARPPPTPLPTTNRSPKDIAMSTTSAREGQTKSHPQQTNPQPPPPKDLNDEESLSAPPGELCEFLQRFIDVELGRKVLEHVKECLDYQVEAQQYTVDGPKWFSINVRRVKDPVTKSNVIIYSARDISGIMQAAKEEADRINREKSEFFAVMAHEIRTPLHQVVGFIELLAKTILNGEQADFVSMLQSSTNALMAIINDLLDFTKLEGGKMTLEKIPFEARGVIEGCLAAVAHQAEEKGVHIKTKIASGIPVKLVGDPNRLRQILLNILSNAVKFTGKGVISMTATRLADDEKLVVLRFAVKDTGIGICSKNSSRIFNAYQQADASVCRNYGGTGLGLAICKDLVENMNGTIGFESEIGEGTTFWFELPFERHQKTGLIPKSHQVDCDIEVTGLRILVAEDNKVNQKVVSAMLKRLGHFPTIVDNGQSAVDEIELRHDDYDLVLMDVQMPVMDGIDATKEIRNNGYGESDLPIVGLTASMQNVDWNQIGMNDCLKKPIRMVDLKKCLAKHSSLIAQRSISNTEFVSRLDDDVIDVA
jgi:signal transduction histidine kinase/CheY-like chemotaxis protein